jgi:hypothetical protein
MVAVYKEAVILSNSKVNLLGDMRSCPRLIRNVTRLLSSFAALRGRVVIHSLNSRTAPIAETIPRVAGNKRKNHQWEFGIPIARYDLQTLRF